MEGGRVEWRWQRAIAGVGRRADEQKGKKWGRGENERGKPGEKRMEGRETGVGGRMKEKGHGEGKWEENERG